MNWDPMNLRPDEIETQRMCAPMAPMAERGIGHHTAAIGGGKVKIESAFQTFPITPDTSQELMNTIEN